MQSIVILISGSGSNMQAIVRTAKNEQWDRHYKIQIAAIISNQAQAPGLAWAREQGLATHLVAHTDYATRSAFDAALAVMIDRYQPALVVLAGFMRVLGEDFVARYEGRLINIHPSLLPAFKGLNTHQRAIEAGCRVSGATVHQVSAQLDDGAILAQTVVPILKSDNAQSLQQRILSQEHRLYPAAIKQLLCTHNNS